MQATVRIRDVPSASRCLQARSHGQSRVRNNSFVSGNHAPEKVDASSGKADEQRIFYKVCTLIMWDGA
jgi:hypothetical protein